MSTVTKLKTNIYRDFVESKSSFLHDVTREVLTELIWKTYNFSSRVLLRKLPTNAQSHFLFLQNFDSCIDIQQHKVKLNSETCCSLQCAVMTAV